MFLNFPFQAHEQIHRYVWHKIKTIIISSNIRFFFMNSQNTHNNINQRSARQYAAQTKQKQLIKGCVLVHLLGYRWPVIHTCLIQNWYWIVLFVFKQVLITSTLEAVRQIRWSNIWHIGGVLNSKAWKHFVCMLFVSVWRPMSSFDKSKHLCIHTNQYAR